MHAHPRGPPAAAAARGSGTGSPRPANRGGARPTPAKPRDRPRGPPGAKRIAYATSATPPSRVRGSPAAPARSPARPDHKLDGGGHPGQGPKIGKRQGTDDGEAGERREAARGPRGADE